jgi:putative restriction endonuclease
LVSRRLKGDFSNGRSYYPLHGQVIHVPERIDERPSTSWLEWHLEERFLG